MTFAWHHPNVYKKIKKEAASAKPEDLHAANTESFKQQASGNKLQATSNKRLET